MLEKIFQAIADFMGTLPPLLQLMAGIFVTIGMVKVFLMIVKFAESRSEQKK
ncbi:hypothetical protein MNBD_NITROSPINAE05-10 [hydrothermal vent metagenome]|uniref:Uncharacterized protein n=1 Tax=hydrothermal vent metagenome TaxID=652676 RepID=A0A3B1D3S6_9ZZZZ